MLGSARSVLMKKASGGSTFPTPLAAYAFNEGSGTTSADATGNGHTLTLNSATWDASGHTGAALTNTASTIGAATLLAAPSATVTIMGWVKPLDLTAGSSHFAFGFVDSAGTGRTIVAVYTQRGDFPPNDVLQGDVRINDNLSGIGGGAMTLNTWAHVALTYDGSVIRLYKDGVLATSSGSVPGAITAADTFCVAGWTANGEVGTDVVVDDVRIFNTALSQAEIASAMITPV